MRHPSRSLPFVFAVPTSLSPSRVESFTNCPLQFRFASIEKLPEPPSPHAVKGSLVHRALELLFVLPAAERTAERGSVCLEQAMAEFQTDREFVALALGAEEQEGFLADAGRLVENYFTMEDPTAIRDIGLEIRLEASLGALSLRGIIDRLELDPQGELIVSDYKTGRAPFQNREQQKLGGVNFYAWLCQEVLGRKPAKVRLLYLRSGEVIEAAPSDQSVRYLQQRTSAVYKAVEKACVTGDFKPRASGLCNFCAFKPWCPAHGGDPTQAAAEMAAAAAPPASPLGAP